jgi:hypothetical protein
MENYNTLFYKMTFRSPRVYTTSNRNEYLINRKCLWGIKHSWHIRLKISLPSVAKYLENVGSSTHPLRPPCPVTGTQSCSYKNYDFNKSNY